jgi:hypothetical protein
MAIAHVLADFSFQSDKSVSCRKTNLWRSPNLYKHALIYALLVTTAALAWEVSWESFGIIGAILFLSHLAIDGLKVLFTDKLTSFLIDQALHIIVLVAISTYLSTGDIDQLLIPLQNIANSPKILVVILGFLTVLWPAGVLISYLIRPFKEEIGKKSTENKDNGGMEKAGLWIGFLERFLTYGLVLAGYPQAISLLIAGKSIFRFGEIKAGNRAEVEYILIGSLLSFTAALVIGQLVKMAIS